MDIHVHTYEQDDHFARQCLVDWQRDKKLQGEFVSFENYVAWKRADDAGLVRVLGKQEVSRGNA